MEESDRAHKKSTLGVRAPEDATEQVPGTVKLTHDEESDESKTEKSSPASDDPDDEVKRTNDGKVVLQPQPEDTPNDPLNWPIWRRNCALLSLGFYAMLGGGMTPVLAAGFNAVATSFQVSYSKVALTTGFYMLGLGVGNVIVAPTAVRVGKRPIYVLSSIVFVLSAVWCALSPSYISLVVARVVQGIAVSPVECLPSATISEIFFLHERGFRVGIYTLLLIGGKNLIPLVSAAIISARDWRWVFWVVAIVVGFTGVLLFFLVPETAWDRTANHRRRRSTSKSRPRFPRGLSKSFRSVTSKATSELPPPAKDNGLQDDEKLPQRNGSTASTKINEAVDEKNENAGAPADKLDEYTSERANAPTLSYRQTLAIWNGQLSRTNWFKLAFRPFVLFAYPGVAWSSMLYALSVGWLIVLSEAVAQVYETRDTYNFTAIQVGLVYISPFIGGVLGTVVAGWLCDVIVRYMSRYNNGIYEPEFRLIMAIPITISTGIGLMGFGWSAEEKDNFMVPTIFFGIISFGCCIGSTTAITYCVDCYRQYASEALVTLNFSKNILHGLVWSLFFPQWIESSGSKQVFVAIGGIQIACLLLTIPMYIYGKKARMWTDRSRMMEQFE